MRGKSFLREFGLSKGDAYGEWVRAHISIFGKTLGFTLGSRRIITPRGGTVLTKLEEIIDPHMGPWDEVLLRNVFLPIDVKRIMQIPLHVEVVEDFVD